MDNVSNIDNARVLARLRPHCVRILQQRNSSTQLLEALQALNAVLPELPRSGLTSCWEYVAYPLHLVIEAYITGAQGGPGQPGTAAVYNSRVGETALGCLHTLVDHTDSGQPDQLLAVVPKVADLLQLGRDAVTEEVHVLALQILTCLLSRGTWDHSTFECLRDEAAAPMVGVLISGCLGVAQGEMMISRKGSRTLRALAMQGLTLLLKVMSSEPSTLAFFLPGISSALAKQLWNQGGGHPASDVLGRDPASTKAALEALGVLIESCLGDEVVEEVLGPRAPKSGAIAWEGATSDPGVGLLGALEAMAAQVGPAGQVIEQQESPPWEEVAAEQPISDHMKAAKVPPTNGIDTSRKLRITMTAQWLQDTTTKLYQLMTQSLNPLMDYPKASVREELGKLVVKLLRSCTRALEKHRRFFIEIMLALAQCATGRVASG